MVRVRVGLGYTMAICLVLQHQVSTGKLLEETYYSILNLYQDPCGYP